MKTTRCCLRFNSSSLNVPVSSMVTMMNGARVADHDRMRRNIAVDQSSGCNQDIIADSNVADDSCVNTDTDIVADGWSASTFSSRLQSYGYTFVNMTILANHSITVDSDVISMAQIQTFTDLGAGRNFNSVPARMQTEERFEDNAGKRIPACLCFPIEEVPKPKIKQNSARSIAINIGKV